ncbi:MAG TPA: hypothetical protein VN850_14175 [Candidatus Acidoferrales bacterium]|nr:hypothetical protein [Candidatus Acidoferrales bacterium]
MSQKNQIILLATLVLIMAVVWYFNHTTSAVAPGNVPAFQSYQLLAVENPQLHRDKMDAAQKTEYHSLGRNPFSEVAPSPEKKAKIVETHQAYGPVPPPPPEPPKLPPNMKFFGYGTIPNGTLRRAFLSDGDEVFIVGEGDTFLGRFRIVKISNANLEFEEIATGLHNTVTMQEEAAPPA